jgi:antitoxin HicB
MTHAFPYEFEPEESGGALLQFVDVPEAHTSGATEAAAGEQALDGLIAALGGYIRLGREIPRPSLARGRPVAILPPLVAAKLALYETMRVQGITRTELARRLGLQENGVRRLLDLDHRSHIDQIDRALAALGQRLEVRVLQRCCQTTR